MSINFTYGQDHILSARGVYQIDAHGLTSLALDNQSAGSSYVALTFFLQYSESNVSLPRKRDDLFKRIETGVAANARQNNVIWVSEITARPVKVSDGYSTEGYLVTAQGYRTRSRKKISSRSGAHL